MSVCHRPSASSGPVTWGEQDLRRCQLLPVPLLPLTHAKSPEKATAFEPLALPESASCACRMATTASVFLFILSSARTAPTGRAEATKGRRLCWLFCRCLLRKWRPVGL